MKKELLELFNKQINSQFYTSYLYFAISTHFDKILMNSFSMYMKHKASFELRLAQKMYDYLILRNEKLSFLKIKEPVLDFADVSEIFIRILSVEKTLLKELEQLNSYAKNFQDFCASEFIEEILNQKTTVLNITRKMLSNSKIPEEELITI